MLTARTLAALVAAKASRAALRATGRGATTLPGLVALALDPGVAGNIARRLPRGTILVTGTNGKTTTTRMLADIVRLAGWHPVHNRSGSNLARGIASALVADATWAGAPRADGAVFEVDEASIVAVARLVRPNALVITNLFRDQLDRYGELDTVARRMRHAAAALAPEATLVLNADDPIVNLVGDSFAGKIIRFGIDDERVIGALVQNVSDLTHCPRCRARLHYDRVVLGHEGDYRCLRCGFARPRPDVGATRVDVDSEGTSVVLGAGEGAALRVPLPGVYNVYNALAAVGAAHAVGVNVAVAARAIAAFRPAFGRLEIVGADGRRLRLVLVKNPAGFNAAVSALISTPGSVRLLTALNDLDADGRDVSWIWDADFEALTPRVEWAVVAGLRARDLSLRLKYAGLAPDRVNVVEGWEAAIRETLRRSRPGEEITLLATYTATLALRHALSKMGYAKEFWED